MPKIDFYVLDDTMPDAHLRHACRLAEQAVEQGQRVFIRATTPDDVKRIDDLLWTFGDRSFLPHEIVPPSSANSQANYVASHPRIRILIGADPPANFRDLVINLSADAAPDAESLPHIAELVPTDAERKRAARERFKVYRDRGIEPVAHDLKQ